jgi:hypothetical protein
VEHVDARRALELMIDIVDQYGEDTVYEKVDNLIGNAKSCRYEFHGHPSCLVGMALHRAGAPLSVLEYLDTVGAPADRIHHTVSDVDSGAAQVFQAAQEIQDGGHRWGDALEKAKMKYEYLKAQEDK